MRVCGRARARVFSTRTHLASSHILAEANLACQKHAHAHASLSHSRIAYIYIVCVCVCVCVYLCVFVRACVYVCVCVFLAHSHAHSLSHPHALTPTTQARGEGVERLGFLGFGLGARTCSPTQQGWGKGGFGFAPDRHDRKALPPDGAEDSHHCKFLDSGSSTSLFLFSRSMSPASFSVLKAEGGCA